LTVRNRHSVGCGSKLEEPTGPKRVARPRSAVTVELRWVDTIHPVNGRFTW
jgi:hypothetical protein